MDTMKKYKVNDDCSFQHKLSLFAHTKQGIAIKEMMADNKEKEGKEMDEKKEGSLIAVTYVSVCQRKKPFRVVHGYCLLILDVVHFAHHLPLSSHSC